MFEPGDLVRIEGDATYYPVYVEGCSFPAARCQFPTLGVVVKHDRTSSYVWFMFASSVGTVFDAFVSDLMLLSRRGTSHGIRGCPAV